jgi:hypothetical protein
VFGPIDGEYLNGGAPVSRKPRPMTLMKFLQRFRDEDACRDYLFQRSRVSAITTRALWQYLDHHHQVSGAAGTAMHRSELPLTPCFLALFLVGQSKRGISLLSWTSSWASVSRRLGTCYTVSARP